MISEKGENLLFIISQPRSGSTLLQRMLGAHPSIKTVSEPWLLLPDLRIFSEEGSLDGVETEYSRKNIRRFLETIKNGRSNYFEALRKKFVHLYNHCLEDSEAQYFLDKTPRYAYLLPEIKELFPQAKVIFLYRNPVAVLLSIYENWNDHSGRFFQQKIQADDLLKVPQLIQTHKDQFASQSVELQFEELVKNPDEVLNDLCNFLNISYRKDMMAYNEKLDRWAYGDQKVYSQPSPNPAKADEWKNKVSDPYRWKLAHDYLKKLGAEICSKENYSYERILGVLNEKKPILPTFRGEIIDSFLAVKSYLKNSFLRNLFERFVSD